MIVCLPPEFTNVIEVLFSPQCLEVMEVLEVPRELAIATINDRHRGLVTDGLDRIIAAHWFTDRRIILVDSTVTQREIEEKHVHFKQVMAQLAIELYPDLPRGKIDRSMSMEGVLAVVAESFGHHVSCHPGEAPAALYTGRWDGNRLELKLSGGPSRLYVCGTFYPEKLACELVWAFDLDRYLKWFERPT